MGHNLCKSNKRGRIYHGQFKSKTRFREFINVPELSLLYNEIADVRNDSNLVLDKPKMKGGGYTTMFIPMNEEQADYGQRIIQFAKTKDGKVLGLQLSENQLTLICYWLPIW
jgi:hypothetical protein